MHMPSRQCAYSYAPLTHMHVRMHVQAQGPQELVALGLHTLEVWVDNYNPEYIEVVIADIIHEFMGACVCACVRA